MLVKRKILKNIVEEITTELRAIMEEWANKIKNGNYKNDR